MGRNSQGNRKVDRKGVCKDMETWASSTSEGMALEGLMHEQGSQYWLKFRLTRKAFKNTDFFCRPHPRLNESRSQRISPRILIISSHWGPLASYTCVCGVGVGEGESAQRRRSREARGPPGKACKPHAEFGFYPKGRGEPWRNVGGIEVR